MKHIIRRFANCRRIILPALLFVVVAAGCQTTQTEPHDHYYPNPGHPSSPDPMPTR